MATWTPREGAAKFRSLEKEMDRQVLNAMRRGQSIIRKNAFAQFIRSGIGRRLFAAGGAGTKQARVIIKRERIGREGTQYVLALKFKGFAALVEQGGRTAAHNIPQAFGRSGSVRHPGSIIHADPFFESAVRMSEGGIKAEVAKGVDRAAQMQGLVG